VKRLLPLALMLAAGLALAASVTVTWQNATENTDNTPIPATGEGSISTTRIEWGTCNGSAFAVKQGEKTVAGTVQSSQITDLPPGRWCLRAYHVNTYGVASDPSGVAIKVIDAPKPKPPSNFS
jgi:predicted phage tail protein